MTPNNEKIPSSRITIPQVRADVGLLLNMKAPMIMIMPKMRNTYSKKPAPKLKNAIKVPMAAQISPPSRTNMPPMRDSMNAVEGFSLDIPISLLDSPFSCYATRWRYRLFDSRFAT